MRQMRDTERVILSGLGGALMVAGIAWIPAIQTHDWTARYLPALALFLIGAAIFIWAFLSGSDPKREMLDRAIGDGRTIAAYVDSAGRRFAWELWQKETYVGIKETLSLQAANEFSGADPRTSTSEYSERRLETQIEYLEGLRKRH